MKLWLALLALAGAETQLYVNCNTGNDISGAGTQSSPFLSLSRARDALRALQPLTAPATVNVLTSNCYPRDATGAVNFSVPILELTTVDSGTAGNPVTYSAAPGASPRLLAGAPIPASAWKPYKGAIVQADLGPSGLNLARYGGFGGLAGGGLGACSQTAAELFFNSTPMTIARWPNIAPNGTWEWLRIWDVSGPLSFDTNVSRVLSWAGQQRVWAHGFWAYDWADDYVLVANITAIPGGARVYVDPATPPLYQFDPNARFYGVNIFSELDVEGEYWINTTSSVMYFMPPGGDATAAEAFLSLADVAIAGGSSASPRQRLFQTPAEMRAGHVPYTSSPASLSYVNIQGLDVHFARDVGIQLSAVDRVTVQGLDASNHGHSGVYLSGSNSIIRNVTVTGTGCEAVSFAGGDEPTLTPGNNSVLDSTMSRYARIVRTYNPGVGWAGVGNTVSGNLISHAPHNGILGGGSLCNFTGNTLDSLCYEASDSGAWYSGLSWVRRGNVIANNVFSNIWNTEGLSGDSVNAVYLDDELSGTSIIGNTCTNSQACYFVGGGRDTVVAGNFCNGTQVCVHIDNRGMGWQADECAYNSSYTGGLVAGLFAAKYQQPPYATAFPAIVDTLSDHPCVPVDINVTGNKYCNTQTFLDAVPPPSWYDSVSGNTQVAC